MLGSVFKGYVMTITSELLYICLPRGIFFYRNYKKATDDTENGEKARGTVAFAQGAKIVDGVIKYTDKPGKVGTKALNIFNEYAKQYKAIDYAGKAVNWATHNVNPLICISGGIKVLNSDDKVHTGITQVGALSGMFLGEGLMKLHMGKVINEQNILKLANKFKDTKGLKNITQYILKSGNSNKLASIIKGLLFVSGSITSYNLGEKLGNDTADRICKDIGIDISKKINQKV